LSADAALTTGAAFAAEATGTAFSSGAATAVRRVTHAHTRDAAGTDHAVGRVQTIFADARPGTPAAAAAAHAAGSQQAGTRDGPGLPTLFSETHPKLPHGGCAHAGA
jgi:hypothetical protein